MDGSLAYVWESAKGSRIDLEQREGNANQLDNEGEDPSELSGWSFLIILYPFTEPVFLSHLHFTGRDSTWIEIPSKRKVHTGL
jgi:hypothetical protein